MKSRKRNKRLKVFVVIVFFAGMLIAGCFVLRFRSDWVFMMQQNMSAWSSGNVKLKTAQVALRDTTLDALLTDSACEENQALLLINEAYPLNDTWEADVSAYKNTDAVMNRCIQDSYEALASAVNDIFHVSLYVRDAYRTKEEQLEKVAAQADIAAKVGASEHQAGLALDLYVPYYAGSAFIKHEAGRYVNRHCSEFGFILRYPSYGIKQTKIAYEPWHYRYVGIPHAEIIMDNYLTLEEYMELLRVGEWYQYENYVFSRQEGESLTVPENFHRGSISEDNMGGYVLTFVVE